MKKLFFYQLVLLMIVMGLFNKTYAQEPFLGEIRMFAGNFAPRGWAACNGQILSIAQNTALFSLLGTTYGGNGTTTFALPDLRGRIPMGNGLGPGLTNTVLGEVKGSETNTLIVANLPAHTHQLNAYNGPATLNSLTGAPYLALPQDANLSPVSSFTATSPNTMLGAGTISQTGNNQPVNNMQPSLTVMFIIALEGIFPPRD